ncbi:hypothetical protein [Flexibacterium corallicola]|uniref:hypothetical protein n=1 Tax=Flexibacterium corallicola TaxID=3037259 RepID=UPI00286FA69A|nr:hypothetical protein [Pseudovibrio sp. M1P-2-3]
MRIPFVKAALITAVATLGSLTSAQALELGSVKGVFTNTEGFVKSFGFCGDGTGAVGEDGFMTNRTYTVKDNLVHVNSNGAFVFELKEDGSALLPADDFTRQWAHAEPYVLDEKTTINCN